MIHLYPLLIFPLTGILAMKSSFLKKGLAVVLGLGIIVNFIYTDKAQRDVLDSPSSNWEFNRNTFFDYNLSFGDLVLFDTQLEQPDNFGTSLHKIIATRRPDPIKDSLFYTLSDIPYLSLNMNKEYFPFKLIHNLNADELNSTSSLYLGGEFRMSENVYSKYEHHILVCAVEKKNKENLWYGVRINNKIGKMSSDDTLDLFTTIPNTWGKVGMYIPNAMLNPGDKVKLLLWNIGKKPLEVRNLTISGYEK